MKVLHAFRKELRLGLRSYYVYMELGLAVVFTLVIALVVPDSFSFSARVYAHLPLDQVQELVRDLSAPAGLPGLSGQELQGLDLVACASPEEVRRQVAADRSAVGVILGREGGRPVMEFVLQGYESHRFRNILQLSLTAGLLATRPGFQDRCTDQVLSARSQTLSNRMNLLPVYLAMNAGFMGLFIIASFIFLDKSEGVIQAFAVTPARVWEYLAGKVLLILLMGLVCGLLTSLVVAGLSANYLLLAGLIIATNFFGSALGLFIASFFDSMAKAMGWLYVIIIVLALGSVGYMMPAFAPLPIRLLPSYPMLFAYQEVFLAQSDLGLVGLNLAGYALGGVVLFGLAAWRFKKTLTV